MFDNLLLLVGGSPPPLVSSGEVFAAIVPFLAAVASGDRPRAKADISRRADGCPGAVAARGFLETAFRTTTATAGTVMNAAPIRRFIA